MPISVQIRIATLADLPALVALWEEFMDFHAARDQRFTRSADASARMRDFLSGRIAHDASCVFAAEYHQSIVGYCLITVTQYPPVFVEREFGSIVDLAVTADCRRQGVGQALVEAALRWFAQRQIRRIEVRVATANELSMSFWRKMGFTPYVEIMSAELPAAISSPPGKSLDNSNSLSYQVE